MGKPVSLKRRYYKFLIWFRKSDKRSFIFLIFLLISGILWLLNALSKEYITEIDIPVQFTGTPRELRPHTPLPKNLTVHAKGKGFTLLSHKSSMQGTFKYDIKPYFIGHKGESDVSIKIITELVKKQIEQYYGSSLSLIEIYPKTIDATFSRIIYKKVAVKFQGQLIFSPQFWQKGITTLTPDSIEIGGPEHVMDTVTTVQTQFKSIDKINSNITIKTMLDDKGVFEIPATEIEVHVVAEKFTEATAKLPIRVLNSPEKNNILLFPDHITVKYHIAIDDYEHIKKTDFLPIVDYNLMQINKGKEKIKVELIEYPDNARNIAIIPREVRYLIGNKR